MNLIEQLGGYEAAKGLFNLYEYSISFKYYKVFKGDFESAGYIDVFIPGLQKALLEHRRQHNIFETDDYIIHDGELKPIKEPSHKSPQGGLADCSLISSG